MFVVAVLCKVVPALILKEMACLLNTWNLFYVRYFIKQHTCLGFQAVYTPFFSVNVKPFMFLIMTFDTKVSGFCFSH